MNRGIIQEDIKQFTCMEKVSKNITEIERKRYSLPDPNLTDLEFEILQGIAEGRSFDEMQNAIKLHSTNDSYNAVVKRLLRKFEAFTLAHVVFKAIKIGLLKLEKF